MTSILNKITRSIVPQIAKGPDTRFSSDFQSFLKEKGYGDFAFAQKDAQGVGGRESPSETLKRDPLIIVHGNSDDARGFSNLVAKAREDGYQPGEIFALSWGPANVLASSLQRHDPKTLGEVRAFMDAVLEYTGAEKADVVGHSMGVTLASKAIKGGRVIGSFENLGPALTDKVDTFVGIAGGYQGLASAAMPIVPTANPVDGFFPSTWTPLGPTGGSLFLQELKSDPGHEGAHVFSIWSPKDKIARGAPFVPETSRIPGQDGEKVYADKSHMELRDDTAAVVLEMVNNHRIP